MEQNPSSLYPVIGSTPTSKSKRKGKKGDGEWLQTSAALPFLDDDVSEHLKKDGRGNKRLTIKKKKVPNG